MTCLSNYHKNEDNEKSMDYGRGCIVGDDGIRQQWKEWTERSTLDQQNGFGGLFFRYGEYGEGC